MDSPKYVARGTGIVRNPPPQLRVVEPQPQPEEIDKTDPQDRDEK